MKKFVRKKRLITSHNPIHAILSNRESCCTHCTPNQYCATTPWWSHQGEGYEDDIPQCQCINKNLGGGGRGRG